MIERSAGPAALPICSRVFKTPLVDIHRLGLAPHQAIQAPEHFLAHAFDHPRIVT